MPFLLLLLIPLTFAHGGHDWRTDYLGFLSAEYDIVPQSAKATPRRGQIDMGAFRRNLAIFSGEAPFRHDGTDVTISERGSAQKLDLARAFLKSQYEALGFVVSFQPFATGVNFIAEKRGTKFPQKFLVLSSHIDSVGNKGANDNGTGTIGVLEVARVLAQSNYEYSVRVLGFDREERGLKGSDAYTATLDKTTIIGNVNFEMMGTNSRQDGAFHIIDCNRSESVFLTAKLREAIGDLALPLTIVKGCTDRSDHASFWRRGMPAVVISENFFGGDSDPCYHARCDVMDDRMNYEYMGRILEMTLSAVESILVKANP